MNKCHSVLLKIGFWRFKDKDTFGWFEVESLAWPGKFLYTHTGAEHTIQSDDVKRDTDMIAFGNELRELVIKYFSKVPPAFE